MTARRSPQRRNSTTSQPTSHKAIDNLLREVCAAAQSAGVPLRALQRADDDDPCGLASVECADRATIDERLTAGTVDVIAGTPWLFARDAMADSVDVVVLDEAGQLSQPSKGTHPPGADRSALEHSSTAKRPWPQSREYCSTSTLPPEPPRPSIGRRRRSGTPIGGPGGRRSPRWRPTRSCRSTCRTAFQR